MTNKISPTKSTKVSGVAVVSAYLRIATCNHHINRLLIILMLLFLILYSPHIPFIAMNIGPG